MINYNLINTFILCISLMMINILLPSLTIYAGMIILIGYGVYKNRSNKEIIAYNLVFALTTLFNLYYILHNNPNQRQYDYYNFYIHGHYIITNNFFLESPISYLQNVFYQPPLWGFIIAFCMQIGVLLTQPIDISFDNIRFINLFFVCSTNIIFYYILCEFKIKKWLKFLSFSLFCFAPFNTILANLVNNDTITYFILLTIIYIAKIWYDKGEYKQAFYISGLLLIGGLCKFSCLMIVPALGCLGLIKLFNQANKFDKKLWLQFIIIGLGAVIGFIWGWFLLYHNLDLVPPLINSEYQNLSHFSILERFTIFNNIVSPFADVRSYIIENNVLLSLIKTSLFGQWTWNYSLLAYIMYSIAILYFIFSIYSFIKLLSVQLGQDFSFNLFIVIFIFSIFCSWVLFWIKYPFFCSSEFRYIAILLPISLLTISNYLNVKNLNKIAIYILYIISFIFIIAKSIVFLSTI